MVATAFLLALAAGPSPADSLAAPPDTAAPRIVRRFSEIVVRAQFHDPLSSESAHLLSGATLRALPVSRLAEAVALKAGVVARGEELHVRGGRTGESALLLEGLSLEEPLRNRSLEVPLLALKDVEVLTGGLEAEYGGSLAGVLRLRTVDPGERPEGALLWESDGRTSTHYDRVSGRLSGPLGTTGIGAVATLEATLDDTNLPTLRTVSRTRNAFGSFGWRADNRLLGDVKLVRRSNSSRLVLEVLANRRVIEPYDPMWSVEGYVGSPCTGDPCSPEPVLSPTPQPGFTYYRAADHAVITDDRRLATVLSWTKPTATRLATVSLGWLSARRVTSVGGGDDPSYLTPDRLPLWGRDEAATTDPFHVYHGDEPFFQKSSSGRLTLRGDLERATARGNRTKAGLGMSYESVSMREFDLSTYGSGLDSLRAYRAFAPGAFGYAQARWVFEGLVLNAGLRAEYFTPGPQASRQSFAGPTSATWTFAPRFGVAYPISVRDVFSLAYVRLRQNPARDYLYDNRLQISSRQQLGNPGLTPATAISYQAAVKHSFSERWALQTAVFYRDLFDLVGTRSVLVSNRPEPRYENADEGHASGFELSLFAVGEGARAELHYTYLEAMGSQSLEEGLPYGSRVGVRLPAIGEHPLDWDRRHSLAFSASWRWSENWSMAWSTIVGSGLPWTPRARRQLDADLSLLNGRRLAWEEETNLRLQWRPRGSAFHVGLEARNLFDRRSEALATLSGYPNPLINTYFDDYGAYRTETGLDGGGYWEDADGDGKPGWIPVHDPRLFHPPRAIRMSVGVGS